MPWILNTAWKIIKSILPPPAVARIKFVTKNNIKVKIIPTTTTIMVYIFRN